MSDSSVAENKGPALSQSARARRVLRTDQRTRCRDCGQASRRRVVRKSVQRERMLPVMCLTMMAMELHSAIQGGEQVVVGDLLHRPLSELLVVAQRPRWRLQDTML